MAKPGYRDPVYGVWCRMKRRCNNPAALHYVDYGGRGIKVCLRWQRSFADFRADMGPRPTPQHTLERRNNEKGYHPNNCCWATRKEQANNRRKRRAECHTMDLTGQIFGRLMVISKLPRVSVTWTGWRCLCVCGNYKDVRAGNLRANHTTSCGCASREALIHRNKTENHATFPRRSGQRRATT